MSECILHTGLLDGCGYGRVYLSEHKRYVKAHRLVYAKHHNLDILTMGGELMHTCDVPECINIEHLQMGTHADNMADMVAKGRSYKPSGVLHPKAKLTPEDIKYIQTNLVKGKPHKPGNAKQLATQFGLSVNYVHKIGRGGAWTHLS